MRDSLPVWRVLIMTPRQPSTLRPSAVTWLMVAAITDPRYAAIVRRDWRMLQRAEKKDRTKS